MSAPARPAYWHSLGDFDEVSGTSVLAFRTFDGEVVRLQLNMRDLENVQDRTRDLLVRCPGSRLHYEDAPPVFVRADTALDRPSTPSPVVEAGDICATPIEYTRRHVLRLSQFEMGLLAGVTQPTICRWENSKCVPDLIALGRIRERAQDCPGWSDALLFAVPPAFASIEGAA